MTSDDRPQHDAAQPAPDSAGAVPSTSKPAFSVVSAGANSSQKQPRPGYVAAYSPFEPKTVVSKKPPIADAAPRHVPGPLELGRSLEGRRLNHFQLEELVGGGGMGVVYRAIDTELGRTVAVKVVASDQTDEETLRRFKNEAQSAARLDHPNIARVYYVGEDGGLNYIVFEYIEGVNIRDLVVHKGPLGLDEAVSYTLQVAEALEHASRRNVVHRDIKPSNLLVMEDGHVKLVDMGLARLHQVQASKDDLTASGVTLGTFDYISPEQARDPRKSDVRSDLYSLGCTFYYMLTGLPPFPDGTVLQKLLSHTSDAPPDPRDFRPDLPEELTAILNKLLAKNPLDRHQSPSELIGALLVFAQNVGLPAAQRGGTIWITSRETSFAAVEQLIPVLVPVLALVLIVAGLQFFDRAPAIGDVPPLTYPKPVTLRSPTNPPPADGRKTPDRESAGNTEREFPAAPAPSTDNEARASTPAPSAAKPASSDNHVAAAPSPPFEPGSSAPAATTVAAKLNTILVGPPPDPVPGNVLLAPTLAAACELATKTPGISQIELRFNGERLEAPFAVSAKELTIRAANGFTPVIVFRPADNETTGRGMVSISGGGVTWSRLHFGLDVPDGSTDFWSLFRVEQTHRVDLEWCTLTIRHRGGDGDTAAFFELPSSRVRASDEGEPATLSRPLIGLSNCLARGQATLVRAKEVLPFKLTWDQGLFISTGRAFVTGGMPMKAKWEDHRVDFLLRGVTVVAARGLCLTESTAAAPFQLPLVARCLNTIVRTEPGVPLVEHRAMTEVNKRLNVAGADSFFTSKVLRVQSNGKTLELDAEDTGEMGKWYDVMRDQAEAIVVWKSLPGLERTVDQQTKADYLLAPNDTNPAWNVEDGKGSAGFDPAQIPNPPEQLFKEPAAAEPPNG